MTSDLDLNQYAYVFFVCEGTNEEAVFNWIESKQRLCISPDKYNKEFLRTGHTKQGKRNLIKECLEYDYNGKVAIAHIRDRENENWNLTRADKKLMQLRHIEIIPLVTMPEIEYLLIINNQQLLKAWNKQSRQNKKLHISDFCKAQFSKTIKDGSTFIANFNSFEDFVLACQKYKTQKADQKGHYLIDIIK